ncbi:MAG: GTP-binding protein [Thermoplasmata archaeon]|nr:GTP-binding protein [Thermoplasmata archaeon]
MGLSRENIGDSTGVKRKIVLLGDSAVGKTSLIRRYVYDIFEDYYIATIGSKVSMKELSIPRPNKTVKLTMMIWDLLGREGYSGYHAKTFAGVHGALLVADLTREETLRNLEQYWIPALFKVVENVPIVFACNKSDLKKESEFELNDMGEVASKYCEGVEDYLPGGLTSYYATSAKAGSNVENAFRSLGHLVLAMHSRKDPVKELYESFVAAGVRRTADKTTLIGALDEIIMDFCEGFDDHRVAMVILRQEIARAGIDIRKPTKEGIIKAVEYLAEAELEFLDQDIVKKNRERRLRWALATVA